MPKLTNSLEKRIEALNFLFSLLKPVPKEWLSGENSGEKSKAKGMQPLPCNNYRELCAAWKGALKWTDGLDRALCVMLAAIASVETLGEQLWVKIIGPASCGKSTLCEAVSVNRRYVLAKSTIRGFHSGYQTDDKAEEDHSLVALLSGKALVTKDGDTLLQAPNVKQILAEGRDLYDRVSRTHYRNKTSRDYVGVRMVWLLCGTSSLRSIDQSELGERFLDCVIMEGIDDAMEDEVGWLVANRTQRNLGLPTDGRVETQYPPELRKAMQLTGGYIDYLRENTNELLNGVRHSPEALKMCQRLAKFIAIMRARPSIMQGESAEREFSARLIQQLIRLANCLAIVMNRGELDEEVLHRVWQVAMDTARGSTLKLAKSMYEEGDNGCAIRSLASDISQSDYTTRNLMRFLRKIGGVQCFSAEIGKGLRAERWRLTPGLKKLCEEVKAFP